jgi:hypothetical protein
MYAATVPVSMMVPIPVIPVMSVVVVMMMGVVTVKRITAVSIPWITPACVIPPAPSDSQSNPPPEIITVIKASASHVNGRRNVAHQRRFNDRRCRDGRRSCLCGRDKILLRRCRRLRPLCGFRRPGIEKRDQHTGRDSIGMQDQQVRRAEVRARSTLGKGHNDGFIHLGAGKLHDISHNRRCGGIALGRGRARKRRNAQNSKKYCGSHTPTVIQNTPSCNENPAMAVRREPLIFSMEV